MVARMRCVPVLCGAALFFAAAVGAQPQKRASQAAPVKAANAWMKAPMDASGPDEVIPYVRHLRDQFWDAGFGGFGVLTPRTVVHQSGPDYGPPAGGDPEVPSLHKDQAAVIGTFSRYRTALTASGRAIYTEVTLSIDRVFQDAAGGHAMSSQEVTVGVPGGTVRTPAGDVISFLTDPQPDYMQPGGTYLLFPVYMPDGDFYVGIPSWDLSDGRAKAVGPREKAKVARGESRLVGLNKDELVRALDGQFSGKR